MIYRGKVSGLKYLIITGTIVAFMGLMSSLEAYAQWSSFSGGYSYPSSFYGGYSGYSYPGSFYGGYRGYPGYGSWSGALYAYGSPTINGTFNINPYNPQYGLAPSWFGPFSVATQYPVGSPLFQWATNTLGMSEVYPGDPLSINKNIAISLLPML